jgi:hypothetical protein
MLAGASRIRFKFLVVLSRIYGFSGAGYTATCARMGTTIGNELSAATTAFGLLNLEKGVENVLVGPIGGALLKNTVNGDGYDATKISTHSAIYRILHASMLCSDHLVLPGHFEMLQSR